MKKPEKGSLGKGGGVKTWRQGIGGCAGERPSVPCNRENEQLCKDQITQGSLDVKAQEAEIAPRNTDSLININLEGRL